MCLDREAKKTLSTQKERVGKRITCRDLPYTQPVEYHAKKTSFLVCLFVCLSVCPAVCLSVYKLTAGLRIQLNDSTRLFLPG